MKIKTTVQVLKTEEIELTIPSFWCDNAGEIKDYYGIYDNTLVEIWISPRRTQIQNTDLSICGYLERIVTKYRQVDEEEFMEAFSNAYKSLSLAPKIVNDPSWNDPLWKFVGEE